MTPAQRYNAAIIEAERVYRERVRAAERERRAATDEAELEYDRGAGRESRRQCRT